MLLSDADPVTSTQLAGLDPDVSKLGASIGLTLDGPGSLIRNAMTEAGGFLLSKFQNFGGYLVGFGQSANHTGAVNNTGNTSISRPRMSLSQVVMLDPNPAKTYSYLWLQMWAMRQIFRAASLRFAGAKGDGDRMEKKYKNYCEETSRTWAVVEACGLPVVITPLTAPGAIREYGAGTWPNVGNVTAGGSGSNETGNSYIVAITWCALPSYVAPGNSNNSESAGSATTGVGATTGQYLTVTTTGCNPPGSYNYQIGTSDIFYSPMTATHWNIYVGLTTQPGILWLQNSTPIPIAQTSHTLTTAPVVTGNPGVNLLGNGQYSDFNFSFLKVIQRA